MSVGLRSYRSIGAELGISAATANRDADRALAKLRQALARLPAVPPELRRLAWWAYLDAFMRLKPGEDDISDPPR